MIKDFLDIFKSLSAPYLLTDGSLLHFHRNFSTGESDVDFSLELWWWVEGDNRDKLKTMLKKKAFKKEVVFGSFGETGYGEAWSRGGIKIDILSSIVANGTHTTGLWVRNKKYFCSYPMVGVEEVTWWERRTVRVSVVTTFA